MSHANSTITEVTPGSGRFVKLLRESLAGTQHDFTAGSLGRAITLLAIPMVLEMAMESLFAICDIFFVARLGKDAVATVGLTESVLTLFYAVAIGLSMATTSMVARRIGEKDRERAAETGAQAIYLGIGVSLLFGLPGALFAPELLQLMGGAPWVIEEGSAYTSILLGTNAVVMLLFLNNATFRGAGDAAVAMHTLWIANLINLVLDPCLIFGLGPFPELGIKGAAIATLCGRSTGVLYQFIVLRRGHRRIVLRGPALRLRPAVMGGLVRVSLGGIGQLLIGTASWVILMRVVSPYGSHALAGYTIAIRIVIFALLPSWGLSNATATLVGQSLGARKPERAERAVWLTGLFNMVFLAGVMVVFLTLAPRLVAFFTDDASVSPVAEASLRIISYGYIFYAWGMVLTQAFNGAGDTMTPTWINLVCYWTMQIPLAFLLSGHFGLGPDGVFWAVATAESVLAVIAAVLFRRGRWKATLV
ncbi:MAG: MATE family efflux transporter [Planctomycetota bacterium]